ncbi:hypothetical protein ABZ714_30655 [Streptomyces sp. NPDC006798]|uniref:hypothetical protein n=1 Tax=Streptomyces sp. NPDC006798 TaxID=3155462 RepID=UPI0033F44EC7
MTTPPQTSTYPTARPYRCHRLRIAHAFYGRLATARAAGRAPKAAVAAYVITTSPLYAATQTAVALWRYRTIRAATATTVAVVYLLAVGFDRLAADYLLPHLHLTDLADWSSTYLAEPLLTIILSLLIPGQFASYFAYEEVACAVEADQQKPKRA